jgi:hypothetical protein
MHNARLDWVAARWIDKMVSSCTIPRRISLIEPFRSYLYKVLISAKPEY